MNRFLKKTKTTNLVTMKKTIGFSNKNNMWTSKYDYVASNYSTIDKKFFAGNAYNFNFTRSFTARNARINDRYFNVNALWTNFNLCLNHR